GLSSLIGKNMRTRGAARGTAGSAVASFTIATPTPKYELPRAQVTLASWPGKHRPRSQASMPWLVSWPRTWDRDCTKVATHYSRPFDEYTPRLPWIAPCPDVRGRRYRRRLIAERVCCADASERRVPQRAHRVPC